MLAVLIVHQYFLSSLVIVSRYQPGCHVSGQLEVFAFLQEIETGSIDQLAIVLCEKPLALTSVPLFVLQLVVYTVLYTSWPRYVFASGPTNQTSDHQVHIA